MALNPVRARRVKRAADWRWSSVPAQLGQVADDGLGDGLTATAPVRERYPDFTELIAAGEDEAGEDGAASQRLRRSESIGRPARRRSSPGWRPRAAARSGRENQD